jgi:5-methylcytosine-specific restriction endonuclease McrA
MGDITRVSTQGLSVHHITPIDQDPTLWDKDTNLLTLCAPCHHMYTELEAAGKHTQSQADGHMVRVATIKKFY